MNGKTFLALGVIGGLAGLLFFAGRKQGSPPVTPGEIYIPTSDDIMAADTFSKLDAYYELANDLYLERQITQAKYTELYAAYTARMTQLVGSV
jgi:hypothetical protein